MASKLDEGRGTRDLGPRTGKKDHGQGSGTRDQRPRTRDQRPEARDQRADEDDDDTDAAVGYYFLHLPPDAHLSAVGSLSGHVMHEHWFLCVGCPDCDLRVRRSYRKLLRARTIGPLRRRLVIISAIVSKNTVAHWCILDNKYVADLPNEAGLNYQLMVEPILDNPQIKRERHFNDLSRFDLKLFYDVSLPKVK